MSKWAEFFSDLCLQEHTFAFQAYRPSMLAAAMLCAARRALRVSPLWSDEMTACTGYTMHEIAPSFERIWTHYVECFPEWHNNEDECKSKASEPTSPTSAAGLRLTVV